MSVKKSLKLNVIMNAILNMSAFIFPLITFPYVSRVLGPDGNGKVAFATALISSWPTS
jgi:O-antigen/teichoic acid export membrane protein